ncbi:hypothetical protein NL444_28225, partial [Klebsiella pneumoniae]|nr:hypothetical protein [Klebsiella pneumoniae]
YVSTSASLEGDDYITLPNLTSSNGQQAFSRATGTPNASLLSSLLTSHPNVLASIAGELSPIGLGVIGVNHASDAGAGL